MDKTFLIMQLEREIVECDFNILQAEYECQLTVEMYKLNKQMAQDYLKKLKGED